MSSPVVVDIMGTIVVDTAKALYTDAAAINYMHGHPIEITDRLTQMTKDPTVAQGKYPLIALFQDFEESKGGDFIKVKLNLIIATLTNREMKAPERYTAHFRTLLYPIYDRFIYQISRSQMFQEATERQISHIKIDRLFWGRNGLYGSERNMFNDHIDCIEIKDLKLSLKLKNC